MKGNLALRHEPDCCQQPNAVAHGSVSFGAWVAVREEERRASSSVDQLWRLTCRLSE